MQRFKLNQNQNGKQNINQKIKQNINKINGLVIRHSDMVYQLKVQVTKIISAVLNDQKLNKSKISKLVTEHLNTKYPTGWVCLVGRNFLANISHEPRTFLRASNESYIFLIYKADF